MKKAVRGKSNLSKKQSAVHGNPQFPYCTAPNSLRRFLEVAPEKPRPPKITSNTLQVWGFRGGNDRSILAVLKRLELLSPTGEPTGEYTEFMNKDTGPSVLGRQLKKVYTALFQNVAHPERASNEDLRSFFNIHSGGGEQTIRYQIETFKALASHATFGDSDPLEKTETVRKGADDQKGGGSDELAIRFDLHIHLPENKTKSDYDAIMESIATHLYRRRD